MKKVAVFGNAGGGKSTLSKRLAEITNLPLHVLDKIEYEAGGKEVKYQDYRRVHNHILESDEWIIDGFGCIETLWERLRVADTLIYVDLPLPIHFIWVTKRLIKGLFRNPEGWPENSPILKSSLNSYRVLVACHKHLTPKYREYVSKTSEIKDVYHLKSADSISRFLAVIESQPF
ncbi:MAG: adenylate kinase [Xenococcaceae cyanobacterium]